jgi:hypothetical protein
MKIRVMAVVLAAFLFFSCDQYPIFHAIYQEVEPKDPKVKGNPTTMVELDGTMYVASRFGKTIHYYKDSEWGGRSSPGGNIMELATDGQYLYALVGDPLDKTEVYYLEDAGWKPLPSPEGGVMQTIRGAGDVSGGYIFASTEDVLFSYKTGETGFSSLSPGLSKEDIVTGAAFLGDLPNRTYYIAIVNKGIYTFDATSLSSDPVSETAGEPIVGTLAVKDKIVAVSRSPGDGNGVLFYGDSSGFTKYPKSAAFSGAMGIWRAGDNPTQSLLLVGIQSSSSSTINGYREIPLKEDGSLDPDSLVLRRPGGDYEVSTVSNADKYGSTMELRVVTSLHQAKDKTLFASTMQHGLWSYRDGVWNAED